MKAICLALCAFVGLAQARPVVLEEVATITRPDASWQSFGSFGVAIDGDYALVSAERFVDDPSAPNGQRHEGAAFLYLRSGTSWNFLQQLGPVSLIIDSIKPGLAMKDGIALTMIGNARVFERSGSTWTWTSYIDNDLQGPDLEISGGRVMLPFIHCSYTNALAHDVGGNWLVETLLSGNSADCSERDSTPTAFSDIQGTRVVVLSPEPGNNGEPPVARIYRNTGNGWFLSTKLEATPSTTPFGPEVAMAGPYLAIPGRRERGTSIAFQVNDSAYAWAKTGLQAVDSYLEPYATSASTVERVGDMFMQRNYSPDRDAYVINMFRVNGDAEHTSTHVATLQTRPGTSVGTSIDSCGNRIIVSGHAPYGSDDIVRIYELPASFETPAVQLHDFESPSAGALWQPAAGSAFTVVRTGGSGVYRQSSTRADASSWLPSSVARDQAVQADVTVRGVGAAGSDKWVGLLTRRSDASNYYYVTLRLSGAVVLKRRVDGVFTTLASAPADMTVGSTYRMRLESIGSAHRVYLDDQLVLTAHDDALTEGAAGVVMYRASADFDNVIVTPSPLTSIYTQDFYNGSLEPWNRTSGGYQIADGVLHQRYVGGYARATIGTPTADQVVRARIRAEIFGGPDHWVGLMARYQNDSNYLYVTLRARGVISLWRRGNGLITQLATRYMPVAEDAWYDVRMEVVGNSTRVYVDNKLMLSSTADPGPSGGTSTPGVGKVGIITYKAWGDYDDFQAYQP
jgi:hypothetical protein